MRKLFKGRSTERDAFRIPRSVQQSIPIKRIYKDGVFQVSDRFSKTWRFFDINYAVASPEKQMELFLGYCGVLNSLPIDAGIKLTLVNRQLNRQEFSRNLLMAYRQDGRDYMRREYNGILLDKASGSNNLVQEKYITVSVAKRSIEEARTFFARVGTDLTAGLGRMDSGIREITLNERLRLFHDFFRVGQESAFAFDLQTAQRRGHDFRDAIAPETLQFFHDHYAVGERVGRTLFLREYASFIKDTMITELMDYPRNMMLSIDIVPVATDEAVSEMHRRIMAVESDITRWQQRQNHHNNFSANIPYDLEQMRKETREFLDDLTARDQRMMYALVTLTHLADSEEQLEQDTEALSAIGRSHGCQFATMKHQQEDALNTVLPYGLRRIDAMRTLTTESTAVLLPFKTQEIMDTGGLYYGVNAVSRNLIICNRDAMLNGHGLYMGVSGSGKSMMAKQEIGFVGLNTNHDIIVVDPEREYGPLIRALGGEVITISASNGSYVNALDISKEYGDGRNPLVLKSEFIMSLCEQLMGAGEIGAKEKSIIDRCTANIYRKYIRRYLKLQRQMFRKSERGLTRAEYQRLLDAAQARGDVRLRLLLETLCATGIRVSELQYITVEAAQNGVAEIALKGKIRTILLPTKLCRKLLKYAKKRNICHGQIFLTRNGNGLSRKFIWAEMKKLCEAAKVARSKVFPHNLRGLFARTFYAACRDVVRLADVLGHSSIETTRIYLLSTAKESARQLDRLGLLSGWA